MKVLLTTLNAKYIHSSLALRLLQKYCTSSDFEISIQEHTINDRIENITAAIYKADADVIGFSCYIWNISMVLEIADRLKKVKPECTIIFGGPEVSYEPKEIMESYPFINYIVMGEGEDTLKELLDNLGHTEDRLDGVLGIAFREKDGIKVNAPRPLICDLDKLPSPYSEEDTTELKGRILYYETTRGCPFNCSYCLSSTIEGVRYYSVERVKKDLLFLIQQQVHQVKFVDRTFNCNKQRTMELFKFLVETQSSTSFHFEIAADLLDDDMIEYLATVPEGLFQLEIGVQSTNLSTISAIERKMNFVKVAENVRKLLRKDNIHLHLDLIAGLPGENYASFSKSFNDVFNLKPHVLQLGFLKLLKGSKIRQEASKCDYKYIDVPPYEILQNNVLSYKEILKLKGLEDVLENYHNSGAFNKSLDYIINGYYNSAFEFFDELAEFFENRGLDKLSHSRKALYDILDEFIVHKIGKNTGVFREFLKFDLVYHQKGVQLPAWASRLQPDNFKESCFEFLKKRTNVEKFLPQFADLPAKKIIKEVDFEVFDINVLETVQEHQKSKTIVLFDYSVLDVYDVTKYFC